MNSRRRNGAAQIRNDLSVPDDWMVIKSEREKNCQEGDCQQHKASSTPKRTQGFSATVLKGGCAVGHVALLLLRQRSAGLDVPLIEDANFGILERPGGGRVNGVDSALLAFPR